MYDSRGILITNQNMIRLQRLIRRTRSSLPFFIFYFNFSNVKWKLLWYRYIYIDVQCRVFFTRIALLWIGWMLRVLLCEHATCSLLLGLETPLHPYLVSKRVEFLVGLRRILSSYFWWISFSTFVTRMRASVCTNWRWRVSRDVVNSNLIFRDFDNVRVPLYCRHSNVCSQLTHIDIALFNWSMSAFTLSFQHSLKWTDQLLIAVKGTVRWSS